ncbi:hypothetical protein AMECASPLE_028011 [Ameca splendens]|uniref:Uncharacterized protein n=1 Tax=Ameca splendens TaxID=208324 RepID=A0ABV1A0W9_9TELE
MNTSGNHHTCNMELMVYMFFPLSLSSACHSSSFQGGLVIYGAERFSTTTCVSTRLCVSVCVSVSRQAEGGAQGGHTLNLRGGMGWVGHQRRGGGGKVGGVGMGSSVCCNMMIILVTYLTVKDNRGLSVWVYEKNLNTKTKTFVDEPVKETL